jgi:hypothetical protein
MSRQTLLHAIRPVTAALAASILLVLAPVAWPAAHATLPNTSTPVLTLDHTVRTTPFVGSTVSMKDNEGSAYVQRDGSLWLADDDAHKIYEVNPLNGALKRVIDQTAFSAVPRLGGGQVASKYRSQDLEAIAYDAAHDILYVFSGNCCSSSVLPTVFRMTRQAGTFQLESYQPLASGSDFTAAGWNPGDGRLYVGVSKDLRSYDYATNNAGPAFQVPNVSGIFGITFSADGKDLWLARKTATVSRVDWGSRTLVPGWTFDLTKFGMLDARAVELIGDQFWVSDGDDHRTSGDPLSHAVFVFNVAGSTTQPTAPTASFAASPTAGTAPLPVSFTDTSTGGPTSWSWSFGDGGASTSANPTHTYNDPGSYLVTLTATNALGSSSASKVISVGSPPVPGVNLIGNSSFETNTAGWGSAGHPAVTLQRVSGGHGGSWSVRVTNTGPASDTSVLDDSPDAVQTSQAGSYTGSLWVRSDSGGKLYLRLREYVGSTKVGETLVGVTLTPQWQRVSGTLVPTAPGSSRIDFSAAVYSSPAGYAFTADDASLSVS